MALMPPKKKAKTLPKRTTSSNAASSTKTKAKDKFPTQANNLFDFYPNLRGDAPLFRPDLGANSPSEPRINAKEEVVCVPTSKQPLVEHKVEDKINMEDQTSSSLICSSYGPFTLDSEDEEEKAKVDVRMADHVGEDELQSIVRSSRDFDPVKKSNASSLKSPSDGDEFMIADEEFDIKDERDDGSHRFLNRDGSKMMLEDDEDEQWTWQEYHKENFDDSDDTVLCPICGNQLGTLNSGAREAHVNACLDGTNLVSENNNCDVSLIKSKEAGSEVKEEENLDCDSKDLLGQPVLCRIKEEPVSNGIEEDSTTSTTWYASVKDEEGYYSEGEDYRARKISTDHLVKKFSHSTTAETDFAKKQGRTASSAFDKIMVSHAEEKAWASAAHTENSQRGTRYTTRICPFYKILSPLPIAVDAFKYGRVPNVNGYYLSHFHSDHYGGLSKTWSYGPIYCSSVTGSLCIQQLKVDPKWIVKLPFDQRIDVGDGVFVTLIDANHCPGSSLFLFEAVYNNRDLRYLHCGDFRASPAMVLHPAIRNKRIDTVYLDTTYLNPKYGFPSQIEVINACSHVCKDLDGSDADHVVEQMKLQTGVQKFF